MTRPQEEVWTAEAEALGLIQCCVWLAATPGDREMCRGSLAGMKRLVEVEVETEVTSPPPLPFPPSLHPTIVHGSILSLHFLLLSSSILRQPAWACPPARLPFIHLTYLASQRRPMKALISAEGLAGSWGGARVEIRVSFIILYKPPSWLPETNSKGNRTANSSDRLIISISNDASFFLFFLNGGLWNSFYCTAVKSAASSVVSVDVKWNYESICDFYSTYISR